MSRRVEQGCEGVETATLARLARRIECILEPEHLAGYSLCGRAKAVALSLESEVAVRCGGEVGLALLWFPRMTLGP